MYKEFNALSEQVGITAFDVGARGERCNDLLPIASGVDWICLEPDEDASVLSPKPWRSVSKVSCAAAAVNGSFELNLYRQRGCSSRFAANQMLAERFSRESYYELDGVASIKAQTLDQIAQAKSTRVDFLKIDIQGMEVECFQGAVKNLGDAVVGIRTEISFFPIYTGQPLLAEVDLTLRPFGLFPAQWLELHGWRRTSKAKLPRLSSGALPFSKGQLIHGDLLYLVQPEDLPVTTDAEVHRVVRLALISLCYDMFDHAAACFERQSVREYVEAVLPDPLGALQMLSRKRASKTTLRRLISRWLNIDTAEWV